MLAHGHPHAAKYHLAKVYYEATLIREREHTRMITEATLIRAVIISAMDGSAAGTKALNKTFEDLRNG